MQKSIDNKILANLKDFFLRNEIIKVEPTKDYKSISSDVLLNLYASILKTKRCGFWVFNPKNQKLYISDELIELLGLPEDTDLIDKEVVQKFFPFNDQEDLLEYVEEAHQDIYVVEKEYNFKDEKDYKHSFPIKISCVEVAVPDNKHIHVMGIVEDISLLREIRDELDYEIDKAFELNSIKNTFLNNISHEIRTPMNAIIGFTELLNIGEITADKKKEYLTIIKNKSRNLLALIDDISELSKFESGEVLLNKTETNLPKLLNELHLEFLREKMNLNKGNVDIFLKLPNDNNIINVFSDPGRIQQVLSYLIDNALKFTEKGYIQFGYDLKDSKHLMFFVKDTGVGIHKEAQKYLFNRFKTKEEVFDRKYHNSGLGLTIARAIVENLGGKIYVDSTLGVGSNFYFTLPLHKSSIVDDTTITEKINPLLNWRNKVILVAEDDIVNYQFLEAVLSESQAQLVHVLDGKQAVELCNTLTHIDLILMDIRMPEKSGYEAIKEIKKIKPNVPIIAQTAYTSKEDREKCKQVGCDEYISKPIDINLLLELINKYFTE